MGGGTHTTNTALVEIHSKIIMCFGLDKYVCGERGNKRIVTLKWQRVFIAEYLRSLPTLSHVVEPDVTALFGLHIQLFQAHIFSRGGRGRGGGVQVV